jgi:hypothetical protein
MRGVGAAETTLNERMGVERMRRWEKRAPHEFVDIFTKGLPSIFFKNFAPAFTSMLSRFRRWGRVREGHDF